METSRGQNSNVRIACMPVDSRVLCAICGASAIGRNFDAYTCLSCKAFFRRNAYNNHVRLTCRANNKCEITITTRRHCSACRLNKCFRKGMKKELIRSLVALKQASNTMIIHRHKLEQLFSIDVIPMNNQILLKADDWNLISNIRNAYENDCIEKFVNSHQTIPLILQIQPYRSRFKLQRYAELKYKYISIIGSFIKHILRDNSVQNHDYDFIKTQLDTLLLLNTSELMKSNVLQHVPWQYERLLFESVYQPYLLQCMEKCLDNYQKFLPYDSIVVKMFLLVFAFSPCLNPLQMKTHYQTNDFQLFPLPIYHLQNYYLTLLSKYIIYRFGYVDAMMFLVRFVQCFLYNQTIASDMISAIANRDDRGQLTELLERTVKL